MERAMHLSVCLDERAELRQQVDRRFLSRQRILKARGSALEGGVVRVLARGLDVFVDRPVGNR